MDLEESGVTDCVRSLKCSYDDKFLFAGYQDGSISIVDIQKFCVLENIQVFTCPYGVSAGIHQHIYFFKNNESAIIGNASGHMKKLCWGPNASTLKDFNLTKDYGTIVSSKTTILEIFITDDEEHLIISLKDCVRVQCLDTGIIKHLFEFEFQIARIEVIENRQKTVVVGYNSELSIIDMNSLQISETRKLITDDKNVSLIKVIC